MSEGISTELCKKLAVDAVTEWKMLETEHRSVSDARKHLLDHIRKQVTIMRENGTLVAMQDKDKRLQPLINECKELIAQGYEKKMVQKFYKHYTQTANDGSGRMQFEALGSWDAEYRFIEFLKREKK